MHVLLTADHRGFALMQEIALYLKQHRHTVEILGPTMINHDDDYPDRAHELAQRLNDSDVMGIALCGSGIGIDIALNRYPHVRCGLGINERQVASGRADDDINALAIAADHTHTHTAYLLVDAFLTTPFEGAERQRRRIKKLSHR
ncbi:MAG: RpiB/LacA/LacB family sugar-phosphate isomerase [Candidatus Roizmanbacteria bacterium]|nr:RpiB/LacA/LacB family sugar-phosphate isomerase [Candidatus Roizmanbacteria bacterium]